MNNSNRLCMVGLGQWVYNSSPFSSKLSSKIYTFLFWGVGDDTRIEEK